VKLPHIVIEYLTHRRALGNRFVAEGYILRAFCDDVGRSSLSTVPVNAIKAFLVRPGTKIETAARKRRVLKGLFRFAQTRGYDRPPPLPALARTPKSTFVPFIYTLAQLRQLLGATTAICSVRRSLIEDYALRALLLTLYGAALRLGEAIKLDEVDVDLDQAVLTIRQTKFFKTRIVPMGRDLTRVLIDYRKKRDRCHRRSAEGAFFCLRNGARMNQAVIQRTFRRLRAAAGIVRDGGPRHQPRLHDLRHAGAVHRLLRWYRAGADLQNLLPRLATYLGHKDLVSTQHYLTMTPQLLRTAGRRFERYALESCYD
jgi:site-specific recombinase XerD